MHSVTHRILVIGKLGNVLKSLPSVLAQQYAAALRVPSAALGRGGGNRAWRCAFIGIMPLGELIGSRILH